MSEKNNMDTTVEALFKGMQQVITTKTVVGEAVTINDMVLLPLIDVSFGVGAGSTFYGAKNKNAGGMGGKISPTAVLVIKDGTSRLVNIKNQDSVTKIIDMVPDIINKFFKKDKDITDEAIKNAVTNDDSSNKTE